MLKNFMREPKFTYNDVWAAAKIFATDYNFFSFDLKIAYHHIVIDPKYYKHIGFSWKNN